jgi:hypothetical protein
VLEQQCRTEVELSTERGPRALHHGNVLHLPLTLYLKSSRSYALSSRAAEIVELGEIWKLDEEVMAPYKGSSMMFVATIEAVNISDRTVDLHFESGSRSETHVRIGRLRKIRRNATQPPKKAPPPKRRATSKSPARPKPPASQKRNDTAWQKGIDDSVENIFDDFIGGDDYKTLPLVQKKTAMSVALYVAFWALSFALEITSNSESTCGPITDPKATCRLSKCSPERNADCHLGKCVCKPGFCSSDGINCARCGEITDSSATCTYFGCNENRNAVCKPNPGFFNPGSSCVCKLHHCSFDGKTCTNRGPTTPTPTPKSKSKSKSESNSKGTTTVATTKGSRAPSKTCAIPKKESAAAAIHKEIAAAAVRNPDLEDASAAGGEGVDDLGKYMLEKGAYGEFLNVSAKVNQLLPKQHPLSDAMNLPHIVVVGMESVGKSSTLERIVGFPIFPRVRLLIYHVYFIACRAH